MLGGAVRGGGRRRRRERVGDAEPVSGLRRRLLRLAVGQGGHHRVGGGLTARSRRRRAAARRSVVDVVEHAVLGPRRSCRRPDARRLGRVLVLVRRQLRRRRLDQRLVVVVDVVVRVEGPLGGRSRGRSAAVAVLVVGRRWRRPGSRRRGTRGVEVRVVELEGAGGWPRPAIRVHSAPVPRLVSHPRERGLGSSAAGRATPVRDAAEALVRAGQQLAGHEVLGVAGAQTRVEQRAGWAGLRGHEACPRRAWVGVAHVEGRAPRRHVREVARPRAAEVDDSVLTCEESQSAPSVNGCKPRRDFFPAITLPILSVISPRQCA